jgi:GT2 family glycosyltransferase
MGERVVNEYRRQLDLVIVDFHTPQLLQRCLDSLEEFRPKIPVGVTVVDVESRGEAAQLDLHGARLIEKAENVGYARACNEGALGGDGAVIGLLNSDTEFDNPDCLNRLTEFLDEHLEAAIVGPHQHDGRGKVTHAGIFGRMDNPAHRGWHSSNVGGFRDDKQAVTVSGSAFFVRRSVWDELTNCSIYISCHPMALGAFPPYEMYHEETFAAYHAQVHGYEVWYVGSASMRHRWHSSSPVGSQSHKFEASKVQFKHDCEAHGIPHNY